MDLHNYFIFIWRYCIYYNRVRDLYIMPKSQSKKQADVERSIRMLEEDYLAIDQILKSKKIAKKDNKNKEKTIKANTMMNA